MFDGKLQKLSLSLALIVFACANVARAQVATAKPPAPPPPLAPAPDTLQVEPARRQTPQVVTIVHRLNGIKALALLRRSGEKVATVDDWLVTATDAVTSITAGFALGDGQWIVARLPQAEIEALTTAQPSAVGYSNSVAVGTTAPKAAPTPPKVWTAQTPGARRSEFVVVESNGKQLAARYVGLDGGTGLSLLKINGLKGAASRDAGEEQLAVGQTVRLFAPVRVGRMDNPAQGVVSVRVGELEGKITEITRTSAGKIAHISISARNLSPAIVGGVALNEAGETIGIVEASDAAKARLVPAAAVRRAASRVQTRQASVPRPWLGVRGEPVAAMPLEKFPAIGWTEVEAAKLKEAYNGILLTSVAPGTPAALADLRPGDVIVSVNNYEVKSPEDFSFVLNEAGGGATVNFTFFRGQTPEPFLYAPPMPPMAIQTPQPIASPGVPPQPVLIAPAPMPAPALLKPHKVSVKLSESLNPARAMRQAEAYATSVEAANMPPPIARGLELVSLSAKAATHLGARGGALVVFVDPESAIARAGLRVFDVIESVNGKLLGRTSWVAALSTSSPKRILLGIVRNHQKVEIKIEQKDAPKK